MGLIDHILSIIAAICQGGDDWPHERLRPLRIHSCALLTEAKNIVSRPLTHLSDDANDMEALTPNRILLGMHRNWAWIDGTDASDITSRKQVQALRAMFVEGNVCGGLC